MPSRPIFIAPLCAWLTVGALLAAAGASAATREPGARPAASRADDIVASVNGRAIQSRDFDLAVQIQFAGRPPANISLQELRAVREKVLQRLIDNELLYQKAARDSGNVPEADVEAEVSKMREHLGGPEDLARVLKDNQVTEAQFREQVRRTLLVTRFVDREVAGGLSVTDDDVKRYYEQNPAEFKRPERARVSQIMVRVPPGTSAQARVEARRKIEEILKALRSGEDFAAMARKHSEGPEAARGGDTGFIGRGGKAPAPIERAAFGLSAGETSDIIETRLGYHIIRVTDRRPEGSIPFEDARKSIRAKLLARARQEAVETYVAGLREKARIERHLPLPPQAK